MTDVIRIKRRTGGAVGAPSTLANAELAYNEMDHTLYIGEGTGGAGGSATVIRAIAGDGLITGKQPLDGDLTSLAAASATGAIYFRQAVDTWTTVTIGSGLSFTAGTLAASGGGGNVSNSGTPVNLQLAQWINANQIQGVNIATVMAAYAPLDSPALTNVPTAPTLANGSAATTQIATTAYVRASRLDQMATPTANVAFGGMRITGLTDPSGPQDAATKNYVDASLQGLQIKDTARLATAAVLPTCTYANGTAGAGATLTATANAALSVDGIVVVIGDNVLVKNQATAFQNGLYVVTQVGSGVLPFILTRHADMDLAAEYSGAFIPVGNAGATNANTLWLANPSTPVTVGTTSIPFTQLNASTTYTAGNGINIAGNVLSAVGVSGKISVGGTGIDIDATYLGQTSITTLGTISSGTWNATTINVNKGGTGATTLTGYVKGAGTSALTASATIPNTDITGLGTMSTQNATAVAITGGTIDNVTFDGGSF